MFFKVKIKCATKILILKNFIITTINFSNVKWGMLYGEFGERDGSCNDKTLTNSNLMGYDAINLDKV